MEDSLRPVIDRFAAALLAAVHDAIAEALRAPVVSTAPPPRRPPPARPPAKAKKGRVLPPSTPAGLNLHQMAAWQREQVLALVPPEGGMGLSALCEATKLSPKRVAHALQVLRSEGKVRLVGFGPRARWVLTG